MPKLQPELIPETRCARIPQCRWSFPELHGYRRRFWSNSLVRLVALVSDSSVKHNGLSNDQLSHTLRVFECGALNTGIHEFERFPGPPDWCQCRNNQWTLIFRPPRVRAFNLAAGADPDHMNIFDFLSQLSRRQCTRQAFHIGVASLMKNIDRIGMNALK